MEKLLTHGDLPVPAKDVFFATKYLRDLRFKFQNPETFEITSVYLTRTDKTKFRVKVFRGGKCLVAKYVEAENFADLINRLNGMMFNL